jgi:hypothetical protein
MEIPTRDNMHNPRRVGLPNTGRDVIPRSLESAVLHPKRGDSDRCSFELHMHGPDCLELSRPSNNINVFCLNRSTFRDT